MAKYNTDELKKQSLEAITKNQLVFFDEIHAFLPCSKRTMYDHKLHLDDDICNLLIKSKINNKTTYCFSANKADYKMGQGYIYIIHCETTSFYKIGISKSKPKIRLSTMQTGCPFPLRMIYLKCCDHFALLEKELHIKYKQYQRMGEWFELTPSLVLCVKNDIKEQSAKQLKLF